jgi:hypothetical protein
VGLRSWTCLIIYLKHLQNAGFAFSDEDLTRINTSMNFYTLIYWGRENGTDYHLVDVRIDVWFS